MKFTIENIAGGGLRTFRWDSSKGLSLAALKHAVLCGFGHGPIFGGEAGDAARAEYDDIREAYLSGQCSEEIEAIFQCG